MKRRILFASVDIGWRIDHYSRWIQKHLGDQFEVKSFVRYKVPKAQYPTDYTYEFQYIDHPSVIQWTHALLFFLMSFWRFDVFHFFSGETLLTRRLRRAELRLYRLLGKRVVMHFVGADIRNSEYLVWKDKELRGVADEAEPPLSTPWQLRLVKDAVDFADHILVSSPDLLEIVPSAEFLPVCLDLEKFDAECSTLDPGEPLPEPEGDVRVLHAPSNVALKGTAIIEQAMRELGKEDPDADMVLTTELGVETGMVYTVPRGMLFSLYAQSDVLVDQLTIGWYGLQSVEALVRGCAVVCGIDRHLRKYLPADCPFVVTDVDDLPQALRRAVDEVRSGRVDRAAQLEWVREYHTMDRYGPVLAAIWLGSARENRGAAPEHAGSAGD